MELSLIENFINEYALILIPVIYLLGIFIKSTVFIADRFIPIVLLCIAAILSCLLNGFNVDSIIQAILCTGVAVYFNQLYKQLLEK